MVKSSAGLSTMDKITEEIVPSLISAGISIALYSTIFGESVTSPLPLFNIQLPAFAVVGGISMASHLTGTVLQEYVLDALPQSTYLQGMESAIVKPAISGLSLYGLARFGISADTPFVQSFGLGAASVVGGDYVATNIFGY
jgi:hypothetical protein